MKKNPETYSVHTSRIFPDMHNLAGSAKEAMTMAMEALTVYMNPEIEDGVGLTGTIRLKPLKVRPNPLNTIGNWKSSPLRHSLPTCTSRSQTGAFSLNISHAASLVGQG